MPLLIEKSGRTTIITINHPERRNAVAIPTAQVLFDDFTQFGADDQSDIAILAGAANNSAPAQTCKPQKRKL